MSSRMGQVHDPVQIAQKAREAFHRYGNCAQASFAVLQEEFNLDHAVILKALGPLPGIAVRGETCGAVIGCLLSLGLALGSDELGKWWRSSLPPAREFCRLFEDEHGSTACGTLLQTKLGHRCDFTDPEDVARYVSAGGPQACTEVVASAARLAGSIIVGRLYAPV